MIQYGVAFGAVTILSLILVKLFARLAHRLDFTDKPTERKRHKVPMPLSGGWGIFAAFAIGFVVFVMFEVPVLPADAVIPEMLAMPAVLFGAALILGIGIVDDYYKTKGKEFPVWPRLLVYFIVVSLVFAAGIRFIGFQNPFTHTYVDLPIYLQFALTMLWFVGLMTAFNMMDGLDGLSGLLALVSGVTFFIVAMYMGQADSAMLSVIFVAAVIGFLKYNLPPTKVFMGDSGAYVLGYLLAVISLYGTFKQATVFSLAIPVLAMGVPIFDAILVVTRRLLARKPAHVADSTNITHFHYRLIKAGMKPGHAVTLIFCVSVILSLASIILMLLF